MSDDYRNYDSEDRSVLEHERMKHFRLREKADAMKESASRNLAETLRAKRKEVIQDASNAIRRGESGALSPQQASLIRAVQQGLDQVSGIDEVITGFDPLPWERD